MISDFAIKNFRCFKELRLTDLRTINVLVGDNGSGKTALLEALLLTAYADAHVAPLIRITRNRSLPQGQIAWSKNLFEFLWEDLFHDFSESKTIRAQFTDSVMGLLKVEVFFASPESETFLAVGQSIPKLVFVRREDENLETRSSLEIDAQGNAVFRGSALTLPPTYILSSTSQFSPSDMVSGFSDLSKQNLENVVVDAMKKDFPEISGISILTDGDVPGLFVTTKSVPNTKIPLALVSSGAARYLNILVAIAVTEKGIVLIDEIENGLYWEKLPSIWKTLRELCVDRGVQLFVTTHSKECLQSLIEAMEEHEGDFSLIRTGIVNGEHYVEQFAGRPFFAALRGGGEVR
jgi:predicted ATPase